MNEILVGLLALAAPGGVGYILHKHQSLNAAFWIAAMAFALIIFARAIGTAVLS